MRKRIVYEYRGDIYYGSIANSNDVNDVKNNAHHKMDIDKKNIVMMAANKYFAVHSDDIEKGLAILLYKKFVDEEVLKVFPIKVCEQETSTIVIQKVSLLFKDNETNEVINEKFNFNEWKFSSKVQREQIVKNVIKDIARRIVRNKWIDDMIAEGKDETDFAFDEEAVLNDEDKERYLSKIAEITTQLEYIGWRKG